MLSIELLGSGARALEREAALWALGRAAIGELKARGGAARCGEGVVAGADGDGCKRGCSNRRWRSPRPRVRPLDARARSQPAARSNRVAELLQQRRRGTARCTAHSLGSGGAGALLFAAGVAGALDGAACAAAIGGFAGRAARLCCKRFATFRCAGQHAAHLVVRCTKSAIAALTSLSSSSSKSPSATW